MVGGQSAFAGTNNLGTDVPFPLAHKHLLVVHDDIVVGLGEISGIQNFKLRGLIVQAGLELD